MAAHTLLFDLDGTLWDSFPWYADFLTSEDDGVEITTRLSNGASIVTLHREYRRSRSHFKRHCAAGPHAALLYPGVRETIHALEARGTTLGVVTNLPGWIAKPMLAATGLNSCLDIVVHAGNCQTRKPHPGPIHEALRRVGKEASQDVFYVGDREVDAQAAARAGIAFAWASYGYANAEPTSLSIRIAAFPEVLAL